ncbi:Aste57867_18564 [Aphanomyces stellatus]|uniref:Aste57867_18564 protein n=1 Tax=Aphanomyces stellatus TaxID=120398 RepID=A0A485LC30_9STRA|nr:hypothetical protein As57867_018502 [Aphanomyces stellatus]VFT95300.1 Aste57867_18564 [Aphanomyces stellatus]
MPLLAHHAFHTRAKSQPNHIAIELDTEWLTYGQLDTIANTLASELAALGVARGDRVAVLMHRCLEVPIALLAIVRIGAYIVPLEGHIDTNERVADFLVASEPYRHIVASTMDMPVLIVDMHALDGAPATFEPSSDNDDDDDVTYILPHTMNVVRHAHLMAGAAICGLDRFHTELWPALARGHVVNLDNKQTPIAAVRTIACVSSPTLEATIGAAVPPRLFMLPVVDLGDEDA